MRIISFWGVIVALLLSSTIVAQTPDWNTAGNQINSNEWFGATAASTIHLSLETRANFRINFTTNNINRMRLMETRNNQTVNGYTGLDLSGFLGIGQFNPGLVNRPYAMLHIDDGGFQDAGYRPWMRQGTMVTHQSDFSYFGMKDEGNAENHTVIAWSDNDIWDPGPDYLKFILKYYSNLKNLRRKNPLT